MNVFEVTGLIYIALGIVYALYNLIKKMDPWFMIPFNIIVGPLFSIYIVYLTLTGRKPKIG